MAFELPKLPYEYNALEPFIDEATMHLHHEKHHQKYIDNLNEALEGHEELMAMDIKDLVANLDRVPQEIRTKVRNNAGGHANHSFFWEIMAPATGDEPKGKLLEEINRSFGDLSTFKDKFSASGMARFGSGWVWLIYENGELKIVDTPNQDTPLMEGKYAILGLDVWEHAYYLKYQNKRAEYIEAFWNVVNWEKVSKNLEKLSYV